MTTKQWFEIKEQSAGKKRLLLTWYLYKVFGEKMLYFIAFLVAFFTFLFAPKVREYSKKYFTVTENYTGLKPTLINQFKHIHSYANSLADKILVFSGNFNSENIVFEDENSKIQLFNEIIQKRGVFFICNHIGNIEVMQSFLLNKNTKIDRNINVFMSNRQSQIFNDFLKTIKIEYPIKLFHVEDIGFNTGVDLKENLDKGEIVFIAGDRLAENNDTKNIETELFAHKIYLPKGTFKLAKLMEVPTYFISAIKIGKQYKIIFEKQNTLSEKDLINSYTKFLEKVIKINPFQFFHFYDFFLSI